MHRRHFLQLIAFGGIGMAGFRYWPDEGIFNPCMEAPIPSELLHSDLVQAAWEGIDPAQLWDSHVHLIGVGDNDSGIWINPDMDSVTHPIQMLQKKFYLNSSCADVDRDVDHRFIERLLSLLNSYPEKAKLMLLAFDYTYNKQGERLTSASSFYTPNGYAQRIANTYPDQLEWIASIHPYREDAIEALHHAADKGARAVKWLPPAQGMDPASSLCDDFYDAMAKRNLPLLTHAGTELAVHGDNMEDFGNPLRLRRPLEHGVKIIVAHCASLGSGIDLDKGKNAPMIDNFDLFVRLLEEKKYEHQLFGEISAITQINRAGEPLNRLISNTDWHPRLINGSDYPLPGVMPLFSLTEFVDRNLLKASEAKTLSSIRKYNPLLFDFVLKRTLKYQGKTFSSGVFESRRIFV
jgi:mannonate dehydratase